MNINWKVRLANRQFWIAIIPALAIAVQLFAEIFGVRLDFGETSDRVIAFVNAAFVVLAILGIVNDPTTATLSDSERALGYDKPKES